MISDVVSGGLAWGYRSLGAARRAVFRRQHDEASVATARVLSSQAYATINKQIRAELAQAGSESSWLPSLVEQVNDLYLREDYLEPRLPYFRSMLLTGGAVGWPDCPAPGLPWYSTHPIRQPLVAFFANRKTEKTYRAVLSRMGGKWPRFEETLVGHPYHSRRWVLAGTPQTEANLRYSFYYGLLAAYVPLDRISSVLEIGGGYGGLAEKIALRHPEVRVSLVELPRMCAMACYYLRANTGAELIYQPGGVQSARVGVLLPWVLSTFSGTFDIAINTSSFQHMDARNLRFYFGHLRRLGVKTVFSVNREAPVRRGEAAFLENAAEHGYRVERRTALEPWSDRHFLHVLTLGPSA